MGTFKRHSNPNQGLLLPPSLRDWLPPEHPVWLIKETVEELDLSAFLDRYRSRGETDMG